MKKIVVIALLFLMLFTSSPTVASAELSEDEVILYEICDENGIILTERENVEIGDKFIDSNLNEFEIYLVDEVNGIAKARYIQTHAKPNITKKSIVDPISSRVTDKKIALYMTHNDESYVIGDGTDSIYGAGGIHDIAKTIKSSLENYGVDVTLDETLHIPHNSSAYSRSAVTATNLLKDSPDAIFDIHRDGTSRSYYLTTVNGKEHSKIRIVLGQSNPNSAENLQFAMYLLSVAEVECPWLFQDIYWGKGHYNQALSNKALLFEMGTHLIEKDYVQESAKELANIINLTLYNTTIDENNDLTIGDDESANPTVNEKLDELSSSTNSLLITIIPIAIVGLTTGGTAICFHIKKKKITKNNKK